MARFSKTAVVNELEKRINGYKNKNDFDLRNGTAQLNGKSPNVLIEYGMMMALITLRQDILGDYIKE